MGDFSPVSTSRGRSRADDVGRLTVVIVVEHAAGRELEVIP